MSSASDQHALSAQADPLPSVRWRSWPLVDELPRASLVLLALVAAAAAIHWATGEVSAALLAAAALCVALWRFFLPVWFELSAGGVDQWIFGRRRRIPWGAIHRYEVRSTGVLFLPRADRCPIDAFRGLYLPFSTRREEVLAQIHHYLDRV